MARTPVPGGHWHRIGTAATSCWRPPTWPNSFAAWRCSAPEGRPPDLAPPPAAGCLPPRPPASGAAGSAASLTAGGRDGPGGSHRSQERNPRDEGPHTDTLPTRGPPERRPPRSREGVLRRCPSTSMAGARRGRAPGAGPARAGPSGVWVSEFPVQMNAAVRHATEPAPLPHLLGGVVRKGRDPECRRGSAAVAHGSCSPSGAGGPPLPPGGGVSRRPRRFPGRRRRATWWG